LLSCLKWMYYSVKELFLSLTHSRRFCRVVNVTSDLVSLNFQIYSYCHLFNFKYYLFCSILSIYIYIYVSVVTYILTMFIGHPVYCWLHSSSIL
jgi:hypothetical protein